MLENPNEAIVFDEKAALRAIYPVTKLSPTTLLFQFGEAPWIKVVVP
ncbi:MAG: hypothetical protein LDL51_03655 [Chloroflexi bacterium]|nr:hypothetical protein [Chloroflexota bacterium]